MIKAAIITPAYRELDHRLWRAINAAGLPSLVLHEHSDLPRVRSVLIEQGLASGAERLILLDADTVPNAATLRAFAESEDVTPERALWGMYPLRQGDRWSVNPEDPAEADLAIREGRSFRLLTGGLGLCAIHRASLERLGETLPEVVEDEGLQWRPFCVPFVRQIGGPPLEPAVYYADDGALCVRLRESGTELWCNPRLRAGHAVTSVITALRG
jgi:hypothetical protein